MRKSIFLILVATLALSSCLKDDSPNFYFVPLSIKSAELPESFSLNQTYAIQVTYNNPDQCTSFYRFEVAQGDTTMRNVVVFATKRTDQEVCDETITEETRTFNFKVIHSQTYLFRFWQGEDAEGNQNYFEVEVPVQ